jgi:hypothetical protein
VVLKEKKVCVDLLVLTESMESLVMLELLVSQETLESMDRKDRKVNEDSDFVDLKEQKVREVHLDQWDVLVQMVSRDRRENQQWLILSVDCKVQVILVILLERRLRLFLDHEELQETMDAMDQWDLEERKETEDQLVDLAQEV